ncbi:hypothetical protein [Desmospora profundinema]|uniref:Uncharacterized protein n=1 Tax=Desmospora profundinema TaxID=1571184 RepID=A0ABU1IK00_9BACL|nr:hypothetical protein [Desmospora profundinema]MDR6225109.1 hypothetical protein [Desmospora profundinema]
MKENRKTKAAELMEETDTPLPSGGYTEGTPLDVEVETNKQKETEGRNRPST